MKSNREQSRFMCGQRLIETTFSETWDAVDKETNESVELTVGKTGAPSKEFQTEIEALLALDGCVGVPKLLWSGGFEGRSAFAVRRGGPTLGSLLRMHWRLPIGVILKIAVDVTKALQTMHERGYMHLGIHPENVRLSLSSEEITLSGFHTAVKYTSNVSAPPAPQNFLFASSRQLAHARPSPRDDLESLSYLLSYAQNGNLPWSSAQTSEGVLLVRSRPEGKQLMLGLPSEFPNYHAYVHALKADTLAKYHMLRKKFREAAQRLGVEISLSGLWVRKRYSRRNSESRSEDPALCATAVGRLPELREGLKVIRRRGTVKTGQVKREESDDGDTEVTTTLEETIRLKRIETLKTLQLPSLPSALRSKRTV